MNRTIPGILLCLLSAVTALAADAPLDATTRDFDQIHLALAVKPDFEAGRIRGTARHTFASLVPALTRLRLHCEDTRVLGVTDGEGRALPFVIADGILGIDLAAPLAEGEQGEVSIVYESTPTRGLWFHAPSEKYPFVPLSVYSQGEGTDNRHWIPCYDEPDDRLTVELSIHVPDVLKTISNGLLVRAEYLPGPERIDHWEIADRVPTYLISLIAGPYAHWAEEHDGVIVEYHAFRGRLPEARQAFARTPQMIAFMSDWLGVDYPYDRYAQTVVWDFVYGGMENTTATTMNMRVLHDESTPPVYTAESIVAHELAHQWFGDWLTCRTWHHIWLNEGFATYFADLWFEDAHGTDEFRVRRWRQTNGYRNGTREPESLGLDRDPRGDRPLELFGGKQYGRGAAILHMLRLELGDAVFRAAIARYLRDHADSAVVTEDFRRAAEEEAGRDLGWFFDEWVYGAGYPRLEASYRHDPEDGVLVLTVRQTQPEAGGQGVFRFTLPVSLRTDRGPIRVRLPVRRREHEFRIPCAEPPIHVRLDDGAWLLARIETEQSLAAWADQAATCDDPVGRIEAARALARFGEDGARAIAAAYGDEDSWPVRREAVEVLRGMTGSGTALGVLEAAVADDDPRVREAAAGALGERSRDEAGDTVLGRLSDETHPYVKAALARSLGLLHVAGAREALLLLLDEPSHREVIREGALDGLRALGDPSAVELAIPFLDYRWGGGAMSSMRHAALHLVLALDPDSRRTRKLLVDLLDDPYFRMRAWAAGACGDYGVREAKAKLADLAEKDRHGGPKRAAKKALENLK